MGRVAPIEIDIMAEKLDPKEIVTLEELALSNMWEIAASVALLERKGILTRQGVLAMISRSCASANLRPSRHGTSIRECVRRAPPRHHVSGQRAQTYYHA